MAAVSLIINQQILRACHIKFISFDLGTDLFTRTQYSFGCATVIHHASLHEHARGDLIPAQVGMRSDVRVVRMLVTLTSQLR